MTHADKRGPRDQYNWMYQTKYWKLARLAHLQKHPLCALCLEQGYVRGARVVHHMDKHNGDWTKFVSSPLQSLCKEHHDGLSQSVEVIGFNKGCNVDGSPIEGSGSRKIKIRIRGKK